MIWNPSMILGDRILDESSVILENASGGPFEIDGFQIGDGSL